MYLSSQLLARVNLKSATAILFILILPFLYPSTAMAEMLPSVPNANVNITLCTADQNRDVLASPEASSVTPEIIEAKTLPAVSSTIPGQKPPSLNSDLIFSMINDHRKAINLPPLEKNDEICKIAESRGPAIYGEVFVTHNIHAGFYALNLPYWATENMKYGGSEADVFNWWMNSPIHRRAIEGNYKYSCGACYGQGCVQIFTNFQKK